MIVNISSFVFFVNIWLRISLSSSILVLGGMFVRHFGAVSYFVATLLSSFVGVRSAFVSLRRCSIFGLLDAVSIGRCPLMSPLVGYVSLFCSAIWRYFRTPASSSFFIFFLIFRHPLKIRIYCVGMRLMVVLSEHIAINVVAWWCAIYTGQIRLFGFRVKMKTFVLYHGLQKFFGWFEVVKRPVKKGVGNGFFVGVV